jgi:MarR family transcriptional regulator, organic hydroperoxide resistance regulator
VLIVVIGILDKKSRWNVWKPVIMPASPDSAVGFFENYLPHLLTLAAIATSRAFDHKLRERGVSLPVWRVMAVLVERPGETVTGLAKRCLLQQPTMTKLLDRMESDRLVRRSPDRQDHRVVRVSLTSEGATVAALLVEAAKHHETALLARHPQAGAIKDGLRSIVAEHGRPT